MSAHGTAGLYFLQPGFTINGAKYLHLLKDKLEIHVMMHDCHVFIHDDASCPREYQSKTFYGRRMLISWTGQETVQI